MTLNTQEAMFLLLARDAIDAAFASYIHTLTVDTINNHMVNESSPEYQGDGAAKWRHVKELWSQAHADISGYFQDATWPDIRYTIVKEGA
jgi:hypothetical protein